MSNLERSKETLTKLKCKCEQGNPENKNRPLRLRDVIREETNWKELGSGFSRTTFAIDRWHVVKVTNPNNLQQTHEIRNWQKMHADLKKWIVGPLVWAEDFSWAIYPRAKPFEDYSNKLYAQIWETAAQQFKKEFPKSAEDDGDILNHESNWGLYLGKPKILDYGCMSNYKPVKGGD